MSNMTKTIIKNEKLGEEYYSFKHECGLTVLLYPMKGYSSCYALFGTNLGSIDTTFKTNEDDEFTVVPEGVAHFLEHKLFESEDGDAFSLFAKTGASANAYTSFEKTCYLFSATDKFGESLESLLKFVQAPYFTEQTVQKEQGIIGQEIKMYEDNPGWRVFFNLLGALYVNHPVKIDIAGTVESIAKIDAELLYKCYNTFYNLNNMVLSVAGNFDVDEAISIIENNLKIKEKVNLIQKVADEPAEIANAKVEQKLQVSTPLFNLGFKEAPLSGKEALKAQLETEIFLDIISSESSSLYKRLYDAGLINASFGFEVFQGRGYFATIFSGESKDPEKVQAEIIKEIEKFKETGISEEDFACSKKAMYGQMLRDFNDVESVANGLIGCYFAGLDVYDNITTVGELSVEDINKRVRGAFNNDQLALSVILPTD